MSVAGELFHGTGVAIGSHAVLLKGPSGAGKSDLALRFLSLRPRSQDRASDYGPPTALVGDDQIWITEEGGKLVMRPAETLAGLIEVRGVGIMRVPHLAQADLNLIVTLTDAKSVPRLPPSPLGVTDILGHDVPTLKLCAFEASAAEKLYFALSQSIDFIE